MPPAPGIEARRTSGLLKSEAAAGRPAGILVFQMAGAFCRFHPRWHGLFLEGGFEHENRFVHVPLGGSRAQPCERPRHLNQNAGGTGSVRRARPRLAAQPAPRRGRHGHRHLSRALLRLLQDRHQGLPCRQIPGRSPAAPSRFSVPTHSDLRPVFLTRPRDTLPGSSAAALREGGSVSHTCFAWLPRGGSATIRGNHPSLSAPPRSQSPSCPSRPRRAAPHGHG